MIHQYDHTINQYRHRFFEKKLCNLQLKNPDGIYLVKIYEAKTMKMSQLIEDLPFHKSNATRSVLRLAEKGLVTKSPDVDDLRGFVLSITPTGKKVATEVVRVFQEWEQLVLQSLTKEELHQIDAIREKIYLFLKNHFEEDAFDD